MISASFYFFSKAESGMRRFMSENRFKVPLVGSKRIEWFLIGSDTAYLSRLKERIENDFQTLQSEWSSQDSILLDSQSWFFSVHIVSDMTQFTEIRKVQQPDGSHLSSSFIYCGLPQLDDAYRAFEDFRFSQDSSPSTNFYTVFSGLGEHDRKIAALVVSATQAEWKKELQRISDWEQWLRNLKHFLSNQLMRVKGRLELVQQHLDTELNGDSAHIGRMRTLNFSALKSMEPLEVAIRNLSILTGEKVLPSYQDLCGSVARAAEDYQANSRYSRVPLHLTVHPPLLRASDSYAPVFLHAIRNLLENAFEASLGVADSSIHLTLETATASVATSDRKKPVVRVRVQDQGRGVTVNSISERYVSFRAFSDAGKLGLGIPTILKILRGYDGSLSVRLPAEGGSEFIVEVPLPA